MGEPTRRDVLRFVGGLAGAGLLSSCATGPVRPDDRAVPAGERLQVSLAVGLAVVDARAGRPIVAPADALLSADRRRLVGVSVDGAGTQVTTWDAATAAVLAGATLRGRLSPRALSADAQLVALVAAGPFRQPLARSESTIVVAGPSGERARHTVPGCVEPEAFSADGRQLFVLDYLPPTAPDRYRVRVMDIATGTIGPLSTRLKQFVPSGAEEEMRGEGRQAVFDGYRNQLFTLYTHQPDHEHTRTLLAGGARPGQPLVHAFVHTLSVRDGWAYCIDLPEPFGLGPASAHSIVRSASGTLLYVVDASGGAVAELDPDQLVVRRVGRFAGSASAAVGASFASDGARLFVAVDHELVVIDSASMAVVGRWPLAAPARGVAASAKSVYVGQPDAVLALDPATGATRWRVPVSGLSQVQHLVA
jgi:hypothetical protein